MRSSASIGAADLLAAWERSGRVPAAGLDAVAEAIAAGAAGREPALPLKILSAVGTVFATGFFLAFLGVAGLVSFDDGAGLVVWGIAFLVVAVVLALALRRSPPGLGADLLAQTAFVATALGKIAFVAGAVEIYGPGTPWVATGALALVTIVTYPVTGSSLDRVLSPYAVAASALFEILERPSGGVDPGLALAVFHALATAIAAVLVLSHRVPAALRPIGTAALAAMGTVVSVIATGHDFGLWANGRSLDPRPVEAMTALALAATIAFVAREAGTLGRAAPNAAIAGAIVLGFAGAPGIVFALLLLVVGHARHDGPVRVAGILALPVFVVLWYYARDLTFLVKSAALVASGVLLLGARGLMAVAGWDREGGA